VIRKDPISAGEVFTALEKIETTILPDDKAAAKRVAGVIADTIRTNTAQNRKTVLGLATGHTPIGVYRELIRMHKDDGLDFSNVITFNLDEYFPMAPDSIQSYSRWMHENFFDHVNLPAANINVPDGTVSPDKVAAYCKQYEAKIVAVGGIDVQVLGVGRTGHIGFNEPGSSRDSRTRLIHLDRVTRMDAASDFFGEENVPRHAITMGVGTILAAKRIVLMAFGENKASIIRRAVEGPVTDTVAASFLQDHPNAEIVIDLAAAGALSRVATPWLLGEIDWTNEAMHRAVIWLSLATKKSILKLEPEDYDSRNLASLVRKHKNVDTLNRKVFSRLWDTIARAETMPGNKKALCFSPHPDDDVISMGGTLSRLVDAGNEVHVAYMTNGNIAVFDDDARRTVTLWADMNDAFGFKSPAVHAFARKVHGFLATKEAGAVDIAEVQDIKALIRRSEALAACRVMGIPGDQAHFLDLPFYKTGEVRKRPIGPEDIQIVLKLLREVRPDWVFVAGELSDPHGTHRLCTEAALAAIRELKPEERPEIVWLYRGAWQEWEPDVIDWAVPLSKMELERKIFGIFKHESQKDKALFPGPFDDREFWQRAKARNTDSAGLYNALGLPEYHAMEAFVRYDDWR
jgi:glucosamine-6-phosphate deaminase